MAQGLESYADEELARRARAGSAPCFEEIVRRYQVPLVRFLARRFPSRRDLEDILQDTFVKAWQSLHHYDDEYALRTWLYTIAYRLAVSRGRKPGDADKPLPEHAAGAVARPAAALEEADARQNIWSRARELLSDEQFTALWLFYVDELPAGDVARILNRSWVSVKTMMHRARKRLAPVLADYAPQPINGHTLDQAAMTAAKAGEP